MTDTFPAHWQNFPDWPPGPLSCSLVAAITFDCAAAAEGALASVAGLARAVEKRLIVYGTLAPGMENEAQLAGLRGCWTQVLLPGRIDRSGRYPFFHPGGTLQSALLFESEGLPAHWARLDRFEGPEYRRIWWPVLAGGKWLLANIYAARV